MLVDPHCLESLIARLTEDGALGAVRPLVVDEEGLVPAGSFGGVLGHDGRMVEWFPREAGPPSEVALPGDLSYSRPAGCSSAAPHGTTSAATTAFYPALWADVDFCHGLAARGWGFGLVAEAAPPISAADRPPAPRGVPERSQPGAVSPQVVFL